jgi:kinesin family member 11
VKSSADIYALLDRGSAKRRTAETLLNKQSSRSHSVFCITVHIREISPDGEEVIKIGKLYLVRALHPWIAWFARHTPIFFSFLHI